MNDRRAVRGTLVGGLPIELVVEDGTDRSVAERADIDGARGSGFEAFDTERAHQTQDASAGAKALFGMGPALQEEFAQRGGWRPDAGRFLANAIDGPVGIAAMTGRHVFGDGRVLVVAARPQVSSDPLTLDENLDGACGEAHLDFGAGEAVGNAVVVIVDVDMIVDADARRAPSGEHVRPDRQGLDRRPIEFFQELPARHAEPADRSLLVEPPQQVADRDIELGEAMEHTIAQTTEEPALDDQHAGFDLRLVARAPWSCRQHGSAVMGCHLGISPVDLRLVETRLDDSDLGVVWNDEAWHTIDRRKGPRVRT